MCAPVPLRLFGNQSTCSGTKCGTCMPGGSAILKIIMGMLKMALQIPQLDGRASVEDRCLQKGHLSPAPTSASKSSAPVANHRCHYDRRRHRRHNLSTAPLTSSSPASCQPQHHQHHHHHHHQSANAQRTLIKNVVLGSRCRRGVIMLEEKIQKPSDYLF